MGLRRLLPYLLFAAAHLALVAHYVSLPAIFGEEPIQGDDFDLHIGQTYRALEGLTGWGRSWVYDVDLLAGEPAGVIVDSGNKGWSLWTFALHSLGVPRAVAFNTFILLGHLLAPVCVFLCARQLGLLPRSSLLAAAFASLYWFFDSFSHWVWWVGMCSFATASSLALLPIALFHRFAHGGSRAAAIACAPLLGGTLLVHPYSFFIMVVPLALLYLRPPRRWERADHLLVFGMVLTALAINGYWLHNALSHWHYILDSAYFGQTGLGHLVADYFSVLLDPTDTGVIGNRTGFRFLLGGAAVAAIVTLRREGGRSLAPLPVTFAFLLVLAYLGGQVPGASQVQPYRFMLPAGLIGCVLAAAFVEHLVHSGALRELAWGARASLAVVSLVGLQHLARDVIYFMPSLVPEPPPLIDGSASPITGYGYLSHFREPQHLEFRLPHAPLLEMGVELAVEWIDEHVPDGERIVIEHHVVGERVAWKTGIEVLGGFRLRNIDHAYSNFFRRFEGEEVSPALLSEYVRTYGVSLFVLQEPRADLDAATSVVRRMPGPPGTQVYRVLKPTGKLLGGPGRVRASTNRIVVEDSDPQVPILLSYHFHEALRCRPDCRVERQPMRLSEVGLIRIPAPHPARVVVENAYP